MSDRPASARSPGAAGSTVPDFIPVDELAALVQRRVPLVLIDTRFTLEQGPLPGEYRAGGKHRCEHGPAGRRTGWRVETLRVSRRRTRRRDRTGPHRGRRRVHRHRRPVRLRQDDGAPDNPGTGDTHRRPRARRRRTGFRGRPGRRGRVRLPAAVAVPVVDRSAERRVRAAPCRPLGQVLAGRTRQPGQRDARAGRPGAVRRLQPAPAVRRHAAAGQPGPRARHRAPRAAARRAVQRRGRPEQGTVAGNAVSPALPAWHDGHHGHPRHQGSGLPRLPGCRDERAPRPGHRHLRRRRAQAPHH